MTQDTRGGARGDGAGGYAGVAGAAPARVRARRREPALLPHAHAAALPTRQVSGTTIYIYLL